MKLGPRAVFAEKVLDLANFAGAAMVFGQFVGTAPLSWTIILVGMGIWLGFAMFGLWLMGAW